MNPQRITTAVSNIAISKILYFLNHSPGTPNAFLNLHNPKAIFGILFTYKDIFFVNQRI